VTPSGKVYLVGAGPGDAGLITLRGGECLRRADVVLYDYLVNPRILEHTRPEARLVCLGRHGHGRIKSQEEINRLLIEHAQAGRTVVRLKGGDPLVFGRAGEELAALREASIRFEIVPGITAAAAAAGYAGVPITHRDHASAVAFVTGQQRSGKEAFDFGSLAAFPGTIVVYMGVTTAPEWSRQLMAAGKPPETPAAVVRRCAWPDQEILSSTLGELPEVLAPGKMRPPVIVILGEVARQPEAARWFEQRPLFGQTVLVTRPRHQADTLRAELEELGAKVLLQPAIEITAPPSWEPVDASLDRLGEYDWLVFSSSNGVDALLGRIFERSGDLRGLAHVRLAAIGPATAKRLATYYLKADLLPGEYRAEALAEALAAEAPGKRFLLARASRGREVLAEELRAAGGEVDQIVVYASTDVAKPDPEVTGALRGGTIHWTTVTSSAIARSLAALLGEELRRTKLVSISPVTSATLRECGFEPSAEAAEYTTGGMIEAILAASSQAS